MRRLFVCGRSALTAIITAASSSSLKPNIFAVIVVALGRSFVVLPLSQPPPSLSAQLLILQTISSHRILELQPSCTFPGAQW